MSAPDLKTLRRFLAFVEQDENGCWLWTGALDRGGYGKFSAERTVKAHRWSFETFVGPIGETLVLDHKCRVRRCVNPQHAEPITNRENTLRGIASRRAAGTLPLPLCTAATEDVQREYWKGGPRAW